MLKKKIEDLVALWPLIYWVRIWSVPELSAYREGLEEILRLGRITPWLKHVRSCLTRLGLEDLLSNPQAISPGNNLLVKTTYWDFLLLATVRLTSNDNATGRFLLFKPLPAYESYLDEVSPPWAKTLFIKFRLGVLKINQFTYKWKTGGGKSKYCPVCPNRIESVEHILFACPLYKGPRRKWLQQLCKNMGFLNVNSAFRVLSTDPSRLIVFCTSL